MPTVNVDVNVTAYVRSLLPLRCSECPAVVETLAAANGWEGRPHDPDAVRAAYTWRCGPCTERLRAAHNTLLEYIDASTTRYDRSP